MQNLLFEHCVIKVYRCHDKSRNKLIRDNNKQTQLNIQSLSFKLQLFVFNNALWKECGDNHVRATELAQVEESSVL